MTDTESKLVRDPGSASLERLGYDRVDSLKHRTRFHSLFASEGPSLHVWVWQIVRPLFDRAQVVVDVGTGLGVFWKDVMGQRHAPSIGRQIVWCDVAPSMVRTLSKLRRRGISLIQCDMDRFPFVEASVDLLLCHSALHYSTNPPTAIAKFLMLLSVHGSLSIMVSGSGNMAELHSFFEAGNYGIDLSLRPLGRFRESQVDGVFSGLATAVEKYVWISTLRVDKAIPVADYFLSHPEVQASQCASAIRQDLVRRMDQHISRHGAMSVIRRQCLYIAKRDHL